MGRAIILGTLWGKPVRPGEQPEIVSTWDAMEREDIMDPVTRARWFRQVAKQEWEAEQQAKREWRKKKWDRDCFKGLSCSEFFKAVFCFSILEEDLL